MLLTISTTHRPATDLGYLLHKNPSRVHRFDLRFGTAHVLFPEASDEVCTAALMVDVDALELSQRARVSGASEAALLTQYVNDRPYAASSLLSVAIANVFGTAMSGRCKERPELVDTSLPLSITVHAASLTSDTDLAHRLFGPLGYEVSAMLSPRFNNGVVPPRRMAGNLTLGHRVPLRKALEHLYVLIPVLDDSKHYWVGTDEVTKLLDRASDWLPNHPERELITRRYLRHSRKLTQDALERLAELDSLVDSDDDDETVEGGSGEPDERLADVRDRTVIDILERTGASRVVDLGCGEGRLLRRLLAETRIPEIVGVDVSSRALNTASRRFRQHVSDSELKRVRLVQGALTYADSRLKGYDAAVLMEIVEHLDPDRLKSFEQAVFGVAAPATVIMTTPNREYNAVFDRMSAGNLRHADHRFEFSRAEFSQWCDRVASENGYEVTVSGIGENHETYGAPTQMAVFTR